MSVYHLFTIFIIFITQKLVLQQSKYVTAKCTETLLPPPYIQFSLVYFVYEDPVVYWVYEDHVERLDGIGLEFNSKPEG